MSLGRWSRLLPELNLDLGSLSSVRVGTANPGRPTGGSVQTPSSWISATDIEILRKAAPERFQSSPRLRSVAWNLSVPFSI